MFDGITRDNFNGRRVLRLEYEAYGPMALREMDRICEEVFELLELVFVSRRTANAAHMHTHICCVGCGAKAVWFVAVLTQEKGDRRISRVSPPLQVFQRWAVLSVAMVHRIGVVPIGISIT